MKKVACILVVSILGFYSCKERRTVDINIIPKPTSVIPGDDWIEWKKEIAIVATTEDENNVALFLRQFLSMKGINASIGTMSTSTDDQVTFSIVDEGSLKNEAYELIVDKSGVHIRASSGAGLF